MDFREAHFRHGVDMLWYSTVDWKRRAWRRRTLMVSIVGLALLAVTAPKVLPVWCLKSVGGAIVSNLAALKLDTDMLAALAFAGDYLTDARREVETERKATVAERDAFVEFAERVESMQSITQPTHGVTTAHVSNAGAGHEKLEQVREQYRETIMRTSVDGSENDEGLPAHMSAEFGSDAAAIVLNGNRFGAPVKQLLVEQARESASQREEFLDAIVREERSLENAQSTLEPVDTVLDELDEFTLRQSSVDELVETDEQIQNCQRHCSDLLRSRQREVQTTTGCDGRGRPFLQEYLYRNLGVTFPVLHTVLECVDRLDSGRSALVRTLCRRV